MSKVRKGDMDYEFNGRLKDNTLERLKYTSNYSALNPQSMDDIMDSYNEFKNNDRDYNY